MGMTSRAGKLAYLFLGIGAALLVAVFIGLRVGGWRSSREESVNPSIAGQGPSPAVAPEQHRAPIEEPVSPKQAPAPPARARSLRCGWLDNPSPGNASLFDKDGEWTIAVQGGHQANGDWPPTFKPGQWMRRGPGSYGYGCVCLTVEVDEKEMNILDILSGEARPLSACRKDRAIADIEKQLR